MKARIGQPATHVVDVEPQFAGGKPLTFGFLSIDSGLGLVHDLLGIGTRHDCHPVVISHDHITRKHQLASAQNGNVDCAEVFFTVPIEDTARDQTGKSIS